jgi:transcriptional regulator with PAS, ATPase and Fis domain
MITSREIPLNNHSPSANEEILLKSYDLEEGEMTLIKKALEKCKGNKSHAAKMLNISWQSLDRKVTKYGLK